MTRRLFLLLQDVELRKIICEAIESVSLVKKEHILLIQSLLSIRWIKRGAEIIELYHQFIIKMMTSKTDFMMLCLSKIIGCFVPDGEFSFPSTFTTVGSDRKLIKMSSKRLWTSIAQFQL